MRHFGRLRKSALRLLVFYILAGSEISVATTKAYSTQLIAAYLLTIEFSKVRGEIEEGKFNELLEDKE